MPANFDMVRLSDATREVGVCANTLRKYAQSGLNLYRLGKSVFFSKGELAAFIRHQGTKPQPIAR